MLAIASCHLIHYNGVTIAILMGLRKAFYVTVRVVKYTPHDQIISADGGY